MARKGKLAKYSEIREFSNVIEADTVSLTPPALSCSWDSGFFPQPRNLVVEIGCGRGEYTMGMARLFPEKNFIGLDQKGARLWLCARTALEENISNAGFVRMQAQYLDLFFPEQSVSEIWITFPDPHHKKEKKSAKKRLTSPQFLEKYSRILKKGGVIHLKTDDDLMYDFTLQSINAAGGEVIQLTRDLYASQLPLKDNKGILEIRTTFEKRFIDQGKTIKYIQFSL